MVRILPLSEVKIQLSRLVADVARRDDEIVITRNGKPTAVIMSAEEYESWKETQEIKENPELMQEIRKGLKELGKGKKKRYTGLDELFGKPAE